MSAPESFDWVAARFDCSLANQFMRLVLMVKSDVDTVNALEGNVARSSSSLRTRDFHVTSEAGHFSVNRVGCGVESGELRTVNFDLSPNAITVSGDGVKPFSATLRLNREARCVLLVDGVEMELWQVRQMALEWIFFN